MPATSTKNSMLSPAASDLGLGSLLNQQRDDQIEEEKRKKRLGMRSVDPTSPAVSALFGGSFGNG